MKARQGGNDVTMLLVEVLESSIFVEDIHALSLAEYHANWAIFKYQSCFALKEDAHLLVQRKLDNLLSRLT